MKIGIDYIGVSAGAVISNNENKFFLAKRGLAARDDVGCWEFPGGSINFHETREEAASRNIKEKYNLDIEINELLGIYDVIDKENKDHWLSTTYLCNYIKGEPKVWNKDKCVEVGWFSLEEVQKLKLSRVTQLNLKDLLRKSV